MTLWLVQRDRRTGEVKRRNLDREPLFTVTAGGGLGDAFATGYELEDDDVTAPPGPRDVAYNLLGAGKPPYRVPTMDEVRAVPWNGMTVATTFAGCGGSSLGYRMAGFRVVWANEFVPKAQESYRANMRPGTVLDGRDVKLVAPEDVLAAAGLGQGELDVFDGSPPCQAFSTAGQREKGWGKDKHYEHGAKQKNEELFSEYVRLLRGLMPRAFVAENVSGLVKGKAKGFFLDILAELKASGYRVEARLLDAQWLGVPQTRSRIIFVGVRGDLGLAPAFPAPLPYRYSVREAIPWIGAARSGLTGFGAGSLRADAPAPTVSASMQALYSGHSVEPFLAIGDLRLDDGYNKKGLKKLDGPMRTMRASRPVHIEQAPDPFLAVGDPRIRQAKGNSFPRGEARSVDLPCPVVHAEASAVGGAPTHALVDAGEAILTGVHGKRSKARSAAEPSRAIMTSGSGWNAGGVAAGNSRRKFTILEVKRICSFPDDFELVGSYAQQWERLGNSVPPLMMRAIAEAVRDRVLAPGSGRSKRGAPSTGRASGSARTSRAASSRRAPTPSPRSA